MEETDNICGAKTRDGSPCERPAGWDTDSTDGRCKQHGGKAGRPPEHGRYAATRSESLQEKIQEYREDPDPAEMWGELAVLRGVLREWLSDMDAVTEENVGVLLDLQNVIRRTLGSINKIQTRSALTAAEVGFLQARVADLFRTYVPKEERDAAIRELREAIDPDGPRMN